jgi:hypothetical protein
MNGLRTLRGRGLVAEIKLLKGEQLLLLVPAQPVDATPSNQFVRQLFL